MQELLEQLLGYVRGAWRFRWYMHLIAWPLCLGGWIMVHQLPDQYEASARIYVDTQSVLRPLLRGLAIQGNVGQEVKLMTRTLLSRPNLEKIARMTDMDLKATTPEAMEALLNRLQHTIKLSGGRGRDNLYSLSYTDADPQQAKQVVQSLLTLFVERSLGDSRKDSRSAQNFLDDQIKEYESRLFAAEERLKEFKRKNIGQMPNDGGEYFSRLQTAMTRLSGAELELSEAVNRRNELRRQLRGEEPTFGMVAPPKAQVINTALDSRIQGLQVRLDDLLLKFTNRHPDVAALQRTIGDLEAQRTKEIEQLQQSMPTGNTNNLDTNPVYQQLRISLGGIEATVAGLKVRVKQFKSTVEGLKQAVDTIPAIEADFKRLNRDYAVNKKNYDTLVARRETAKMSEDASKSGDNVKFRVVDPPFVPSDPASPNRPLLTSAVLVGGWLAGIAFAFFMSQIRPTYDGVRSVTRELGLPVLGSVSRVWNGKERLKRRMEVIAFGVGGLMLMSVYGAYMAYQLLSGGAV